MENKTFIKISISLLLILLVAVLTLQIVIDPLFQYHTPWFNMKPVISNERYQNAGIAKNFDFDNAIIGNSLSENFKVSDINDAFGGTTVKLTASGSHTLDWTYILNLLNKKDKTVKNIILNMDPFIFQASYTELKHYIPTYLYDNNYLNDVNYIFNFSIINDFTYDFILSNTKNKIPDYNKFMLWDDSFKFGKDFVLRNYTRPEIKNEKVDIDGFKSNVTENLNLLLPYIKDMKDTSFIFFFSPFSMIYWDSQIRQNLLDQKKQGYMTACEILSKYDNVVLYLWADDEMLSVMSNLENYLDESHYSPEICEMMSDRISKKQGIVNSDTYINEVEKLFKYIELFDYNSLFE